MLEYCLIKVYWNKMHCTRRLDLNGIFLQMKILHEKKQVLHAVLYGLWIVLHYFLNRIKHNNFDNSWKGRLKIRKMSRRFYRKLVNNSNKLRSRYSTKTHVYVKCFNALTLPSTLTGIYRGTRYWSWISFQLKTTETNLAEAQKRPWSGATRTGKLWIEFLSDWNG